MSKLEEFLDENNLYYTTSNNSIVLNCPNCNKEKLYIHKDELNFICFYCAETTNPVKGANATHFLAELTGINYGLIKRRLSGFVSLEDFANFSVNKTIVIENIKEEKIISFPETAHRLTTDSSKPALEYLINKRGIPSDIAIKYDLRYDCKRKEIVFPVFDDKNLVGYQTRTIDPNCPKAFQKMTLKGFDKNDYLMFENSINGDAVILTEGPITALKFAKSGIGFVATMGKYVSEKQMLRLKNKGVKRIYLALDEDAFIETKKLMLKFENDFEFYFLQLSDSIKESLKDIKNPDFGDCTFDQITLVLEEAVPFDRNSAFIIENEKILKE